MSIIRSIQLSDSSNVDAFSRLRVSEPITLLEFTHLYDKQPLLIDELITGTGTSTHLPNESSVQMSVSAASDRVIRQTKQYVTYQPGKSFLIVCTGVLYNAANTDLTTKIGIFDDHSDKSVDIGGNGIFFEYSSGTVKAVQRSYTSGSQVDIKVEQASWNIDKLDGTGPSGLTVDWTKAQIFVFDAQWLGVGRVRMGIDIGGRIIYCHQFDNANTITVPWAQRISLPIRYEITTSGTGGSMKMICGSVISEGGFNPRGRIFAYDMAGTSKSVSGTLIPLFSMRKKASYARVTINPLTLNLVGTTSANLRYNVLLNATLTGATFATSISNSAAEFDTAATAVSGGTLLNARYFSSEISGTITSFESLIKLFNSIDGTSDVLTVAAQNVGAGNETTFSSVEWQEWY